MGQVKEQGKRQMVNLHIIIPKRIQKGEMLLVLVLLDPVVHVALQLTECQDGTVHISRHLLKLGTAIINEAHNQRGEGKH